MAARPAPRPGAISTDIFETITPAMARNEHGGQHGSVRTGNPHGRRRADPNREVRAAADLALENVTVPHKSSATSSNRYIDGRSAYSAGTYHQAPEPANIRSGRPRVRSRITFSD
jgi:hypothetical protein